MDAPASPAARPSYDCYGLRPLMRNRLKTAIRALGRSNTGRTILLTATVGDPREARFTTARRLPKSIRGFEDLAFLFTSSQLDHGIISQELDEAARLYRVARDVTDGAVVEIGRFKGGSTFLLAAALGGRAALWSYDIHVAHDAPFTGAELDAELSAALARYDLDGSVNLVVGDSRAAEPPTAPVRVLFIDGDHSYDGVRADWAHWGPRLEPDGHVLFHDAVDHGGIGTFVDGVVRLVSELDRDPLLERQPDAGGIAHFVKRR
jgi:predicted O-methyltransferase YrrM